MPEKLARLIEIGFARIGAWVLKEGSLSFEIDNAFANERNVLYAFSDDGHLAYIGKTTLPLRDRLQRYKTPPKSSANGASTNIKNNGKIRECLSSGRSVEIYLMRHALKLEHFGFALNVAAGLEDSLLAALRPPWNGSV